MGMNGVFNGDCLDVIRGLEDESIHLTVFSPPYDAIRTYEGKPNFDLKELGGDLFRVTVDGGVCAMVIQDGTKDFAKSLTTARTQVTWCDAIGWRLFECCIYDRPGRPGAWWNKRFRVDHEYILIFFKGEKPRYFDKEHLKVPAKTAGQKWSGTQRLTNGTTVKRETRVSADLKCRGTVWSYNVSSTEGNKVKLQHPATMPDKLAEDLILCFSREGDTVLDPMCGSGTSLVMAAKHKRNYIGIEISENYCEIACKRLKDEVLNVAA